MRDKKLILVLSVSVLLITLIGIFRPQEINWTPTFAASDKIPFGSYILFNSLPQLFGDSTVIINNKQPYELSRNASSGKSYLYLGETFQPSPSNVEALLNIAARGNDVFVSAIRIKGAFA